MFRLGPKIADGVIMGARGPWGVYAHNTELNQLVPQDLHRPLRHAAGLSLIPDGDLAPRHETRLRQGREGQSEGRRRGRRSRPSSTCNTRRSAPRSIWRSARVTRACTRPRYGTYKFDKATGTPTITNIVYYPAECVERAGRRQERRLDQERHAGRQELSVTSRRGGAAPPSCASAPC